ncbi:hypothetical protein H5410_059687 [Solanum commersonii]|uniref:BED-type domain-containing protein n=1 Tax=Solanum commersonii TaxID=4109 RepID=A0A9J5W3D6_SOLCO|nr:hypothetical protein H5410_059687 [Solanum commersonii]
MVWQHFEKWIDEDGAIKAKCKHCGDNYAADTINGTSQMLTHRSEEALWSECMVIYVIVNTWKFDQELIRKALARMIIIDEQPFSMHG